MNYIGCKCKAAVEDLWSSWTKTEEVESWEGKPNLIKFPYFADTTKRGVRVWKEAQRQGEFTKGMLKSGMWNEILEWNFRPNCEGSTIWRARRVPLSSGYACDLGTSVSTLWDGERKKHIPLVPGHSDGILCEGSGKFWMFNIL